MIKRYDWNFLESMAGATMKECALCHTRMEEAEYFCQKCGQQVGKIPLLAVGGMELERESPPAPKCAGCGGPVASADERFCIQCRTAIAPRIPVAAVSTTEADHDAAIVFAPDEHPVRVLIIGLIVAVVVIISYSIWINALHAAGPSIMVADHAMLPSAEANTVTITRRAEDLTHPHNKLPVRDLVANIGGSWYILG